MGSLVVLIAPLLIGSSAQRTRSGVMIPPEYQKQYEAAIRAHDHKRMDAILAKIPWQNPLTDRLFEAVRHGDVSRVRDLLNKGADPNANQANGWRPLISMEGTDDQVLAIAKLLIAKGAKVNYCQSDQGWTALINACTNGHGGLPLAKYLLSKGADVNAAMTTGETALHMAARYNRPDLVTLLIEHHANLEARTHEQKVAPPPFETSLPDDIAKIEKQDQAERAESIAQSFEPGYRDAGKTPLFEAAQTGNLAIAKLLVKAGADVHARDVNGWTLAHESAKFGQAPMLAYFLSVSVSPNAASVQGYRSLHVAVNAGFGMPSLECIKVLLKAGADPHMKTKKNQTPLDLLDAEYSLNLKKLEEAGSNEPDSKQILDNYARVVQSARDLLGGKPSNEAQLGPGRPSLAESSRCAQT